MATRPDQEPIDDSSMAVNWPDVEDEDNGYKALIQAVSGWKSKDEYDKGRGYATDVWYEKPLKECDKKRSRAISIEEVGKGVKRKQDRTCIEKPAKSKRNPDKEVITKLENEYGHKLKEIETIIHDYEVFYRPEDCWQNADNYEWYCRGDLLLNFFDVSKAYLIRSWNEIRNNEPKKAFYEFHSALKIGHIAENSLGGLTHFHSSLTIKQMCIQEFTAMLDGNLIPQKLLPDYKRILQEYVISNKGYIDSFKLEYEYIKYLFNAIHEADNEICSVLMNGINSAILEPVCQHICTKCFFNKQEAINSYYLLYRHIINEAQKNRHDIKSFASEMPEMVYNCDPEIWICPCSLYNHLSLVQAIPLMMKGNAIGEDLVWDSWMGFRNSLRWYLVGQSAHQAVLSRAALYAYKNDHGEMPSRLKELVPEYLDSIPFDPFTGEELKYSLNKNVIYSVGKNLVDDGGVAEKKMGKYDYREVLSEKDLVMNIFPDNK